MEMRPLSPLELRVSPETFSEIQLKAMDMQTVDFAEWAMKKFGLQPLTRYNVVVDYTLEANTWR